MHSVPSRPFAPRAFLALLTLCASVFAACGGEKPAPIPDPPTVTLTVPQPNTAAPSLTVRVIVSGCDSVSRVDIYDRDTFLKTVPYTSGSMDFELAQNEIKYTRGLAVSLSLNARATCADGRTNSSQPQPATFLPVTKVIKDPDPNGQVVTDFFTAEGSGTNVAFIGCGITTTGTGTLYRVDSAGVVRNSLEMQIPCSAATVVTELNPTSNKRWVWTPGFGAIAVDSNFVVSGKTAPSYKLKNLSVMSNGDALVSDGPTVSRLQHTATGGTFQWTYQQPWAPVGPAKQVAEQVLIPIVRVPQVSTGLLVELVVVTVDATKTGSIPAVSERTILQFTGAVEHPPLTAFNTDGSVIYISFPFNNNQARVQACLTSQDGCEGSAHKWDSQFFPVEIQGVFPYAAGSRLAIVGLQRVWFLDSENGLVANKGGTSVDASGQLLILQVQMGRATSSEFYILAGPAPGSSGLPTMPQEIIAVDTAEKGELFRYEVSSSLSCSVDDSGRLWMRLGNNLVQALTLPEYRAVKP
ncbi:hypothetical protein D7Y21_35245 [Corallococcus sp. AB045]|uniref:hypothetical protein n=1 Tax=Corallococcus sp. AB045 TaxID=2316719 RepID=UPI000ED8B31A|nr:hypothetical protein [Corallococcus sp. AB045]RKH78711.1 hypothetical protein D7Y21_35245 [Corallococcus sp. AB045]